MPEASVGRTIVSGSGASKSRSTHAVEVLNQVTAGTNCPAAKPSTARCMRAWNEPFAGASFLPGKSVDRLTERVLSAATTVDAEAMRPLPSAVTASR